MKFKNSLKMGAFSLCALLLLTACDKNGSSSQATNGTHANAPAATSASASTAVTVNIIAPASQNGICNVKAIADLLATDNNAAKRKFEVSLKADPEANYDYYMVVARGELNADNIRHAVCAYVKQYNCSVYWGNVVSIGMFADHKAAVFPADTSPHYQLTPKICKKVLKSFK